MPRPPMGLSQDPILRDIDLLILHCAGGGCCRCLQRQMLAWQLLRELTVHILAEEAVLYPVVAEQVGCRPLDGTWEGHPVCPHTGLRAVLCGVCDALPGVASGVHAACLQASIPVCHIRCHRACVRACLPYPTITHRALPAACCPRLRSTCGTMQWMSTTA